MNYYALIRRKYCDKHAEEYDKVTKAIGRKKYKEKTRSTIKELRTWLDQYRVEVAIQKDYIAELQRELDDYRRKSK